MIVQRSLKMTNEKSQYGLDDVLWTYALDGMPKVSMSLHLSYPFLLSVSPPSSSAAASDLCVTVQNWRFFPFPPRTFSSASLHSSAHNPKTHTPPHHLFQQWLASLPPSPAPSPPSRRPRSRCASSPSPRNVPGVFFPKVYSFDDRAWDPPPLASCRAAEHPRVSLVSQSSGLPAAAPFRRGALSSNGSPLPWESSRGESLPERRAIARRFPPKS